MAMRLCAAPRRQKLLKHLDGPVKLAERTGGSILGRAHACTQARRCICGISGGMLTAGMIWCACGCK